MLICIRAWPASLGCPSTGYSPPTCSRRGRHHWSAASFEARLPMPLAIKRVMDIDRGVKVGIGLVVTLRTNEEISPFNRDALAVPGGEPPPLCATSGAVLGS